MSGEERERMIRVLRGIGARLKVNGDDGLSKLAFYLGSLVEKHSEVSAFTVDTAIEAADKIGWERQKSRDANLSMGRGECPKCHHVRALRGDGKLRAHVCVGPLYGGGETPVASQDAPPVTGKEP